MPAPSDLDARIARLKGWSRYGSPDDVSKCWQDERGTIRSLPNWTGTLEGVAELLTDLSETFSFPWRLWPEPDGWKCFGLDFANHACKFSSPKERPGECVALAWLSMKEKEETDV